jgi:twitching motility protein PilJ
LLILIAFAVPGAFTVASFNAYRDSAGAISRSEALRGEIRRLDEVLTMSARMAATTGDERWVARYNDNVAPLDHAIKEMLDLAGSPQATAIVRATDDANAALIAMETRSFELVEEGSRAAAFALLSSPSMSDRRRPMPRA